MTIKCLELDGWMNPKKRGFADTVRMGPYTEIEPKLNVNGWFLQGNECWFEVDGKAYSCPREMFDYNMNILNARELSTLEVSALKQIVETRLATSAQKKLYGFHLLHGNKFNPHTSRRKKLLKDLRKKSK
jgi:cation transport regulator ChaC